MNIFCRILGHTWVHKTTEQKVAWNTAKNLSELDITSHGEEPKFFLECQRCQARNENPTREEIKQAV